MRHSIRPFGSLLRLEDRLAPAFYPQVDFNRDAESARYHFGVGNDVSNDMIIDHSGRIVQVGYASDVDHRLMAVTRTNPDGTPDTTFGPGNDGMAAYDISSLFSNNAQIGNSVATSLIPYGDGYLIAGYADIGGDDDIVILNINAAGLIDGSFQGKGYFTFHTTNNDRAFQITQVKTTGLRDQDRIVVTATVGVDSRNLNGDMAVLQFNGNGTIDPLFGVNGMFTFITPGTEKPIGLAIRPQGSILVGATMESTDGSEAIGAFQLTTTGQLDPSFMSFGMVSYPTPGIRAEHGILLGDGSMVIAGAIPNPVDANLGEDAFLAKLRPNGTLDPTFGTAGFVIKDFGSNNDAFHAVSPTLDGGLVAVGRTQNLTRSQADYDFLVASFTSTGSSTGSSATDFAHDFNQANAVIVDPSGRVLVSGTTGFGGDDDFLLYRYEDDIAGNLRDSDGDGLPDLWETQGKGVDINRDGIIELDLYAMGARPDHKDLFVEIDAMANRTDFVSEAIAKVVTAFANAPVTNASGRSGINLIVNYDEATIPLASWRNVNDVFPPEFDAVKNQYFGKASQRADGNWAQIRRALSAVQRYAVIADEFGTGASSGIARGIPGADFIVSLGNQWRTNDPTTKRLTIADDPVSAYDINMVAGTIMHEFGHSLGLYHGGTRDGANFNPIYQSVMNYRFQLGRNFNNRTNPAFSEALLTGFPNYADSKSSVFNDWANILYSFRDGGPGANGANLKPHHIHREEELFAHDPVRNAPRAFVAPGPGLPPSIRILDATTNQDLLSIPAFESTFTGGVRIASGDLNGDGYADAVAGTGPGRSTLVRAFDGLTGELLFELAPFESSFQGGVYVSLADFNNDGTPDLVITPDQGGGPRVRILNGKDGSTLNDFFGIEDTKFRGGARASTGDVNGDGVADLIVSAGFGGGPRVAIFNGQSILTPVSGNQSPPKLVGDFFAFESNLRNGVFLAAGDINNDGFDDLIFGAGPGGGPRVTIVNGPSVLANPATALAQPLSNFFAGDVNSRTGIHVATANVDKTGGVDLITGSAPGFVPILTSYTAASLLSQVNPTPFRNLPLFETDVLSGVFVG